MDDDRIETFWQSYLDTPPEDSPIRDEEYVAEGWGDSRRWCVSAGIQYFGRMNST